MLDTATSTKVRPKQTRYQTLIRFWLGVVISAVFLYLVLRKVDIVRVWEIVVHTLPVYLLLSALVVMINLLLRAVRWKLILDSVKKVDFRPVFSYLTIGYMINNVLPLRMGELGRSVLLAEQEHMSKSSTVASVAVERGFDIVGLAGYLPVIFITTTMPSRTEWGLATFGVVGAILLLVSYMLVSRRASTMRLASRVASVLPTSLSNRALRLLDLFLEGMSALNSKKRVLTVLVISAIIWLVAVISTSLNLAAFRMDLPLSAALLIVVAVNFASALPAAPGSIGVAHYASVFALTLYGVEREKAVAFGIVSHALIYTCTTIPGMLFAFRESRKIGLRFPLFKVPTNADSRDD